LAQVDRARAWRRDFALKIICPAGNARAEARRTLVRDAGARCESSSAITQLSALGSSGISEIDIGDAILDGHDERRRNQGSGDWWNQPLIVNFRIGIVRCEPPDETRAMSTKDWSIVVATTVVAFVAAAVIGGGAVVRGAGIGLICGSVAMLITRPRGGEQRLPDESLLSRRIRARRARGQ
jgi:hypothetical protein